MAAFIQKLFKSRKPKHSPAPEPAPQPREQERQEQQDDLRAQQATLLAATPSPQQLEQLALSAVTADLRRQAAERIEERDSLQRVQKATKGKDKGVFQIVRQKLQDIRDQEEARQRTADTIRSLIQQAEDQAKSEDTKLYEARLEALANHWRSVEPSASKEEVTAFLAALHRCRERTAAMAEEQAEQQRHQEQAGQRASTLELLTETLDELKHPSTDALPSVSALDALQKTQENRWLEATRDTSVEKQEQKTYEALMQTLKAYISAVRRLGQHREELEAWLAAANDAGDEASRPTAARELLHAIDWPRGFPQPAVLAEVALQGHSAPQPAADAPKGIDQAAVAADLKHTLEELEQALEARQLKESRQLFKKAQQQHKSLDKSHGRQWQARLQLLGGQLRELNDWQGFATQPKQTSLCEQMEYLADQPMEPEAKAERIKELQNEWRELGGSSDRTLWARFKQASDLAYEPCKAYFSAKSGLKQTNLAKRATICDELQVYVDNIDWNSVDWKAVEQIHRTARDEWKAAWPVEFRDNRAVQKRFDDLIKQIETPLNAEREKNEALKLEIVNQAEALIDHDPLTDAMNQAKALQNQWREIGITRHREDRKLWRAFRKACDAIFARREAQRSEQEQQAREADQLLEQALARSAELTVDTVTDTSDTDAIRQELADLQGQPCSRAMETRLNAELKRLTALSSALALKARLHGWQQRIEDSLNGQELDVPKHWQDRSRPLSGLSAREIVIRAEILSSRPSPDDDQALRMEIQVQRLSDGLSGGGESANASEQLESLVAAWCLELPAEERNRELADRFRQALTAVQD